MKLQTKLDALAEKLERLFNQCEGLGEELAVLQQRIKLVDSEILTVISLKDSIKHEQARKVLKVS